MLLGPILVELICKAVLSITLLFDDSSQLFRNEASPLIG